MRAPQPHVNVQSNLDWRCELLHGPPMTAKTSQAVLALAVVVTACVCTTMAGASSTSSPPPGRIVYSAPTPSSEPFMFSLFTAAADGSGARQITGNSVVSVVDPSTPLGGDMNPRWSPDGNRIAFTRLLSDNLSSVFVVNADGTNLRLVSRGGYSEHPKWSPDGRWIAFQEQLMHGYQGIRDDRSYRLWMVRPDGSGRRRLDAGGRFADGQPFVAFGTAWDWSPDSRQIAFVYADQYDGEVAPTIYLLDMLTGRKRRLTTGTEPAWSHDGTRIAFVDRCGLWLIPAKGGKPTQITPRPKRQQCLAAPAWSPDGRWIATKDNYAVWILPHVTRHNGTAQNQALLIRPAAVRWPRDASDSSSSG